MFDPGDVRGIIFDYGGTIDSRGDHWSEVIFDAYAASGIPVGYDAFRPAYVHAERYLATHRLILPQHNFGDLMRIKTGLQLQYLADNGDITAATADKYHEPIARACYETARRCVTEARPTIAALAGRYPLVLVSNFYGNIDTVLADFGIREYFRGIIESAVIGIRKPDARIFAVGCTVLDMPPASVMVIGDSVSKDLRPAASLGCMTALVPGRPWRDARPDTAGETGFSADITGNLEKIAHTLLS